jgi:hypothetical protein
MKKSPYHLSHSVTPIEKKQKTESPPPLPPVFFHEALKLSDS